MPSNFVPLHVHSHYSLLDGLAKIDELVAKANEYGYPAMALTDHGVMYGIIEFYQKAKAANVKPIIGCEVYLAPRAMTDKTPKIDTSPYHLILLAKNELGYRNLIQLVTQAHLKGYYYKPRVDKELLKRYSAGLIALTSCLQGEIPRLILSNKMDQAKKTIGFYKDLFGQNGFYLELQHHPKIKEQNIVNRAMQELSVKTDTGLIATHDTHYLNTEDAEAHEVLLAIQTGKDIDDKKRLSMLEEDFSFQPPDYFLKNFKNAPQAIENSLKIAQECNVELDLGKFILPHFETPNKIPAMTHLRELAEIGLKKRYPGNNQAALKRLQYELSTIEKTNFADYFLIVADFINWAKNQGVLVGPGRGSAAGSIVSYCLNITNLDPLRYDLLFERFLNPDRIAPPDIDMDFADDRRDEVIKYVRQKYGEDHVSQIITFGVMKARLAIRDCGRALGVVYQDVDKIAKMIPFGFTIEQTLKQVDDFRQLYQRDPQIKRLVDMTKKLEGVVRHASMHAAGVVISQKPLTEYVPLQHSTRGEEEIITQYSMYDIEKIGLLKMDFLGLANLTVIKNALRIIRKIREKEIDLDRLPLNDPKTFQLLAKAETTGVFQLESDGMKRYLKELKPTTIDDIIAMVALYRPGPLELIPDYIAGKHGKKKITYLHPKLEPILKDTYGVAVYQEQLLQMARAIAGFSLGEADVLRKAVGKKIKKLLMEQKKKFIDGAGKNKIPKTTAEKIFSFIEPFARYGFNKSHAASYAIIAYQTAYLKARYPAEFMAALLTSDFGNLDRVAIEIAECERMGVKVFPPSVNQSFVEFGVIKDTSQITFGLSAIKNVGVGAAQTIADERQKNGPYKNFPDFLRRLGPEVINKKVVESLAKAGALDEFAERNQILGNVEVILKFSAGLAKEKKSNQVSLFEGPNNHDSAAILKLNPVEPANQKQRLAWEKELLGIYLSEHPLDEVRGILNERTRPLADLAEEDVGQAVIVGGIILDVKKIVTKRGEPMLFAKLEDTSANRELVVFPKTLKKNTTIWQPDNIVIVRGKIDAKDGVIKILADDAQEIGEQLTLENTKKDPGDQTLTLYLDENNTHTDLERIKKIILDNPGVNRVALKVSQHGDYKEIGLKSKIKLSAEIIESLTKILNQDKIEIK